MFNGSLLAELRDDAGLLQKQLASILGVKTKTITAYETGGTIPSLAVQIRIAKHFDVSLDYLNGLTDVRASYNREKNGYCVVLPKGFTYEMKQDVIKYIMYLRSEHKIK